MLEVISHLSNARQPEGRVKLCLVASRSLVPLREE